MKLKANETTTNHNRSRGAGGVWAVSSRHLYSRRTERKLDVVKQHLAAGTDVNADYFGEIPLTIAAGKGQEIVELLITEGADVNASCGIGWTPLHLAAGKAKELLNC